jgi:hypothetical protein
MSFKVFLKRRDDGDYDTLMAFNVRHCEENGYPIAGILSDLCEYFDEYGSDVFMTELEDVTDIIGEDVL